MTIQEYIPLALRTLAPTDIPKGNLLHAGLGIATEALELQLAPHRDNQFEELGDLCWYLAVAAHELKAGWPTVGAQLSRNQIFSRAEELASAIKAHVFYDRILTGPPFTQFLADLKVTAQYHFNTCVLEANIAKLRTRYPHKFTTAAANTRNLSAEAQSLRERILNENTSSPTKAQSL